MTRKLYWEDSYASEFTAKIESIEKEGIVLDKTLFFPLSGNQASDKGILIHQKGQSTVDSVSIHRDKIFHQVSSEFKKKVKIGDTITGKIDWGYRYGIMRAHTSQHIFSAIFLDLYNAKTSRANIEFEEVSIHLDRQLDDPQIIEGIKKVNKTCTFNKKPITARSFQSEEIPNLKDQIRSEIPNKDKIRLIEIEDLDLVCCGGTHLNYSTEVGPIVLTEFKKGNEIRYYVGLKAIELLSKLNIELLNFADRISIPLIKIEKRMQKFVDETENIKLLLTKLKEANLHLISNNPKFTCNDFKGYIIDFSIENKILKNIIDDFPSNSIIVIYLGSKRYQVISNTKKVSANSIIQGLIKKYGGKGGGSAFMAQAGFDQDLEDLEGAICEILNIS